MTGAMLALGAQPEAPAVVCAYCWPRLIQAEHVEDDGLPSCIECHGKADKVPGGPSFLWNQHA